MLHVIRRKSNRGFALIITLMDGGRLVTWVGVYLGGPRDNKTLTIQQQNKAPGIKLGISRKRCSLLRDARKDRHQKERFVRCWESSALNN
jgi:hypothetical protein